MRVSGTASWEFVEDNPQLLHLALFVRDAVGLVLPPAPDVPPPLVAEVPDRSGALAEVDAGTVAEQWITWWRGLLDFGVQELQLHRYFDPLQDAEAHTKAFIARHEGIFNAPEFPELAHSPELRSVVIGTWGDAREWSNDPNNALRPAEPPARFEWSLVESVAADVAFDRRVPIDDVFAAVHLLAVQGNWSYRAEPGYALCSIALAADAHSARALLYDVFASGLS